MLNTFFSYIKKRDCPPEIPPTHRNSSDFDLSDDESPVSKKNVPLATRIVHIQLDIARIKETEYLESARMNAPELRIWESKITEMIVTFLEKKLKFYNMISEHQADLDNSEIHRLVVKYEKMLQELYFAKQQPSHMQLLDLEFKLHEAKDAYSENILHLWIELCNKAIKQNTLKVAMLIANILDKLLDDNKSVEVIQQLLSQSLCYGTYTDFLRKIIRTKSVLHNTVELISKINNEQQKQYLIIVFNSFLSLLILQSLNAYKCLIQIEELTHNKEVSADDLNRLNNGLSNLLTKYTAFHQQTHQQNLKQVTISSEIPMVISEDMCAELESIMLKFGEPLICHADLLTYCHLKPVKSEGIATLETPVSNGIYLRPF